MGKSKQDIIDFAQKLFLEYDSEGKKVHSLRDIAKKIRRKFDRTLTAQTINNWAKKHDWIGLNARIKQQSIEKATDEKFTKEEQLIDIESDKLAIDFKNAENLANVGFSVALNEFKNQGHKTIKFTEALAAIRLGTDIKFRINDMPESKPESKIKQIFKIGDQEIIF